MHPHYLCGSQCAGHSAPSMQPDLSDWELTGAAIRYWLSRFPAPPGAVLQSLWGGARVTRVLPVGDDGIERREVQAGEGRGDEGRHGRFVQR